MSHHPSHIRLIIAGGPEEGWKSFTIPRLLFKLLSLIVLSFIVSSTALLTFNYFAEDFSITELTNRSELDSLRQEAGRVSELRLELQNLDRKIQYIRELALFSGYNTPPTLDEFLSDSLLKKSFTLESTSSPLTFIPHIRPTNGIITQAFSENHPAVDISANIGTIIRATAPGVVTAVYHDRYLGNVVEIQHGNEYSTFYGHCDRVLTRVNAHVERGEVIATVGTTGEHSTGPHLHYQVLRNDIPIDPQKLFQ